jgi:hypothetical protein
VVHPANPCSVCINCSRHGINANFGLTGRIATAVANSGPKVFLCRRCETDEMQLYNERLQHPQPAGPGTAPSLASIVAWPQPLADIQNLCKCDALIRRRSHVIPNCHACRDVAFLHEHTVPFNDAENILRTRNKNAIEGRTPVNGPGQHLVSVQTINARAAAGIGRMCPCGGKPEVQPPGATYMTVCLGCMGVRIDPANLPARLQNVPPRRVGLRSGPSRTKGPQRALRRWDWRVNIERGWDPADRFINGT